MKLPSLSILVEDAKKTFLRFPFVILIAILGSAAMIRIVGLSSYNTKEYLHFWYNLAMTASLGIPLLFSLAIFSESRKHKKLIQLIIQITGIILLTVYFFTLSPVENIYDIARYFLYVIAFHLLVSFSQFLFSKNNDLMDFWNFNQRIFLRIILSGLYTIVLYGGLAIALLAFDKLFEMDIAGKRYAQLFFLLAGVFNTWFFCSGVPELNENNKNEFLYPNGLKVFTQFILLPIVVIYVLILYLYLFKILFSWSLPLGWVSYLVIGFSTAGIFSLLLIYPLKEKIQWIKIFSKLFFIALIPQIILLFISITRRTSEYGITERRYYVYVLAGWLAITTIFYIINNFKNIKYIPISLCLIAILTSFGPWGAFSLSINSQVNRLEEILTKNNLLQNNKIIKASNDISEEENRDVHSILNFLIERNKLDEIQKWFDVNLQELITKEPDTGKQNIYLSKEEKIINYIGLKSINYNNFKNKNFISIKTKDDDFLEIKDYNYMVRYKFNSFDTSSFKILNQNLTINTNYDDKTNNYGININQDSIKLNVDSLLVKIDNEYPNVNDVTFNFDANQFYIKFIINSLNATKEENKFKLTNLIGILLLRKK